MRPDVVDAFGHFASAMVSPETRLRITESGHRAVRRIEPFHAYERMRPILNDSALYRVLATLRSADRRGRSVLVDTLVADLSSRERLQKPVALRHIMWLLKNGFADVDLK
jgi:hypothetical protein